MADSDRINAPLPGKLPSEFIRPPVLPKTMVTVGRGSQMRAESAAPGLRRAPSEVRLPCMLYAAVGVLPRHATLEVDIAITESRRSPGVIHVIPYPGLVCEQTGVARSEVAVVARGYWLARQALARLMVQCGGVVALPASNPVQEDVACPSRVTRGTAHFVDGRLRLWLATSQMEQTRALAARLAGIAEEYVDLRVVGEAEGAAPVDVITAALALARELQPSPVQVIVAQVVTVPLPAVARLDDQALAVPEEAATAPRDALAA